MSDTRTEVDAGTDAPSITTILFTDVEGSTEISTRSGDRAAQDLRQAIEQFRLQTEV